MLNEVNMKYFLCLAETLSFTEAGKHLYVSQQAVSKQIAAMEEYLNTKLFVRTHSGVVLTDSGERYCELFQKFSDDLQNLRAELADEHHVANHNLRIGYQNWIDFGPGLSVAMQRTRDRFPEITLIGERYEPGKLVELLAEGQLDMIVIHRRFVPKMDGLQKLELVTTPMQMVVSEHNPLVGSNEGYKALRKEPMIIDALEGEKPEESRRRARKESHRYDFEPSEIIVVPNRDSVYTTAELNGGIFFSSSMAVLGATSSLVRYDTNVMETLYAIWSNGEDSPYIQYHAKKLREQMEEYIKDRAL